MIALCSAAAVGALVGLVFGPLRLAGVDYGKWYRDPGEVSELNDRTWIGLMKSTALSTARRTVGLGIVIGLAIAIVQVAAFHGSWTALGAAIAGLVVAQALIELAWRLGLRQVGRPVDIRLSHSPRARAYTAPAPATRRRLIVCCDGTWNSPDELRETNVVQLLRAIKSVSADRISQVTYYHLGVGTGNVIDRFLGGGAGIGLSSSVKATYAFLADNYQDGDEILLFGFSRGAYVARSLAGLLGCVGLLRKTEMHKFDEAWDFYTQPKSQQTPAALDAIVPARLKEVRIRCVGVWDTVGALGVPGTKLCSASYAFHDTSLGPHVQYAFQALALDERRGNFQPAIWVPTHRGQVLEQVWFPGVHSDIGGGYQHHGLSDTTLRWMLSRLQHYGLLDLDMAPIIEAVNREIAEPYPRGKLHDSRSPFWKAIGCPVPRPVGITDTSEQIHQSARDRAAQSLPRDPYTRPRRRAWLQSLPASAIAALGSLETAPALQGVPPGNVYVRQIPRKKGLCAWIIRHLFGGA